FRAGGHPSLAAGLPHLACRFALPGLGRDGPGRCHRYANVASHVHRRHPGGSALDGPGQLGHGERDASWPWGTHARSPPAYHQSTRQRHVRMSYSLATLWHERQRYLPGVLAVGFSALLIALQCGLLLGLFSITSIPVDRTRADIWVGAPQVLSVDLGRPVPESYLSRVAAQPEVE